MSRTLYPNSLDRIADPSLQASARDSKAPNHTHKPAGEEKSKLKRAQRRDELERVRMADLAWVSRAHPMHAGASPSPTWEAALAGD
jgi:hypothetical protein